MSPPSSSIRIRGLDAARALALFGMILVHFHLVVAGGAGGPAWLATCVESPQGRAAATFVVLAGVGGSLGSRRARLGNDPLARRAARFTLLRRGLFLFVVGCLFFTIWPADILHNYGLWLALGSLLLFVSSPVLLAVVVGTVAGNAVFLAQGTFFDHWNLADLSYQGQWSAVGFVRSLFLDGWNPFLPWFGLYTYGLWLGRQPLGDARWRRRRVLPLALLVVGALTGLSKALAPGPLDPLGPHAWLATTATPPTPAFALFGGALATAVILLCIEAAERWPRAVTPLVSTGQLALTLYLAHVFVGLGALEEMGRLEGQSLPFAMQAGTAFFALAVLFSVLWRLRFRRGPLEAVMRALAG